MTTEYNLPELLDALTKEAFYCGFCAPRTYNDTVLNSAVEEYPEQQKYFSAERDAVLKAIEADRAARYPNDAERFIAGVPAIRYDLLSLYASKNRLDYNELCRLVRDVIKAPQPATLINGLTEAETCASASVAGLMNSAPQPATTQAQDDNHEIFAWATFDGEGSYDLRLYEHNETYRTPMNQSEDLLPCPCGQTPAGLCISGDERAKWAHVSGDCCGDWMIEFRNSYNPLDSERCNELAIAAWNRAQRASAPKEPT